MNGFSCAGGPIQGKPFLAIFSGLFRRYQRYGNSVQGTGLFCLYWKQGQGKGEDSPWIGGKSLPRSA